MLAQLGVDGEHMPITSWKLTLSSDKIERNGAIIALDKMECVEIGPIVGYNVAIVVESDTPEQDAATGVWLTNLRGVEAATLVFADFSDVECFDRAAYAAACATAREMNRQANHDVCSFGDGVAHTTVSGVGNLTETDNAGRGSGSGFVYGDDHVSR